MPERSGNEIIMRVKYSIKASIWAYKKAHIPSNKKYWPVKEK